MLQGVPRLRGFVAGLSAWRSGFNSRPVRVRFVADKAELVQVLL